MPVPTPEAIRERGELRVATLNRPTTWYLGTHGPEGRDYELATALARSLGVRLTVVVAPDRAALGRTIVEGRADLAVAQLTAEVPPAAGLLASTAYESIPQYLVYRRGRERPRSLADLSRLRVVVDEQSEEALWLERQAQAGAFDLEWIVVPESAEVDSLDAVSAGRADVALVDAYAFAFSRPLHPELAVAFAAPVARQVAWWMPAGATGLKATVDGFLERERRSGRLARGVERILATARRVEPNQAREFGRHIDERLPRLQPLFERASVETGLDWRLIAALAYQESQWNPRAVSPNGAQGVMMLMPPTARSLGVTDPFDPEQSILAGARYLVQKRAMIPSRIPEPDRTWMAIASYNMGFGNLEGGRVITQLRGGNPDRWSDVRENLPLLSETEWYTRTKGGYARGWEGKHTVDRVQQFANVLAWRSARATPMLEVSASPETEPAASAVLRR